MGEAGGATKYDKSVTVHNTAFIIQAVNNMLLLLLLLRRSQTCDKQREHPAVGHNGVVCICIEGVEGLVIMEACLIVRLDGRGERGASLCVCVCFLLLEACPVVPLLYHCCGAVRVVRGCTARCWGKKRYWQESRSD